MKAPKTQSSLMLATPTQICRLRKDHADLGDFYLMTDGYTVWLSEQKMGQSPKQHFEISRGRFNRLIGQYVKQRKFMRK